MILIAKLVILTFTIVLALKVSMSQGMIFEKIGDYFERKVDKGYKVFDLFICPWCMNSLQVFTAHAFAFGLGVLPFEFNLQLIVRIPLVVFGASFVSGNLWNTYETINSIKEKNKAEAEYFNSLIDSNEP